MIQSETIYMSAGQNGLTQEGVCNLLNLLGSRYHVFQMNSACEDFESSSVNHVVRWADVIMLSAADQSIPASIDKFKQLLGKRTRGGLCIIHFSTPNQGISNAS